MPTLQRPSSGTQHIRCVHLKGRWKQAARTHMNAKMCLKVKVIIMVEIRVAATATMNRSLCSTTAAQRTTRSTTGAHLIYVILIFCSSETDLSPLFSVFTSSLQEVHKVKIVMWESDLSPIQNFVLTPKLLICYGFHYGLRRQH